VRSQLTHPARVERAEPRRADPTAEAADRTRVGPACDVIRSVPPAGVMFGTGLHPLRSAFGPADPYPLRRRHGTPSSGGPSGILRRDVLTKIETPTPTSGTEPDWVADVIIGGRSPSPFSGTMGAHSTAWVAHLDAIRRHLVNLAPADGAAYLIGLVEDSARTKSSPLLALEDTMPSGQKALMVNSRAQMIAQADRLQRLVDAPTTTGSQLIPEIRGLIADYLTYVNYLPTATVAGGDPAGHGEGVARGLLNQFEDLCSLTKREAGRQAAAIGDDTASATDEHNLRLLAGALDQVKGSTFGQKLRAAAATGFDPARNPALTREITENLWSMFAAETPGVYAGQTSADLLTVWTAALKNFLHTIRLAYPYSFEFTAMNTPAAQLTGLEFAINQAGVTIGPDLAAQLRQAVTGKSDDSRRPDEPLAPEEPELRGLDQYAEVSTSDLLGGGAGFVVTVLMSGTIVGSVEMTGRTQSPFATTMGAHTTAWAATLDALRAQLKGKDLDAAIATLRTESTAAMSSERLTLSHLIDEKHQSRLANAHTVLSAVLADRRTFLSEQSRIDYLETLIKAHLSFTNLLPLSTVESGGVPGGRAEGRARTFLQKFETDGEAALPSGVFGPNYVTEQLCAMFDPGSLQHFPPDLGFREGEPISGHALSGHFGSTDAAPDADEVRDVALREFYQTVNTAYPKAVAFIGWALDPMAPALPESQMDTERAPAPVAPVGGGMKRVRPAGGNDDVPPGPAKKRQLPPGPARGRKTVTPPRRRKGPP
jgi:hypothetical protein